jgi:hypothetical protein
MSKFEIFAIGVVAIAVTVFIYKYGPKISN